MAAIANFFAYDPFLLEVPGNHLNRQGILKNIMLGTKIIRIGPLGPDLAIGMSK